MIDLHNEREIFPYDRNKPQILNSDNYVENMFLAVGFASRCWTEKEGKGVFDTDQALRLANELCAYVRLIKAPIANLDYLEWQYQQSKQNGDSK